MGISRDAEDKVPTIDSTLNLYSQEVIGNKDDTVGGTSLVATAKRIEAAVGGTAMQLKSDQSISTSVEENGLLGFGISLIDIDTGAVLSANIDISSISAVMYKSTGGAAFSSAGITQPTFGKVDGLVSCDYQFKSAEWEIGDVYKLVVSGITALVHGDTAYVKTMVWSSMVLEEVNVEVKIDAIQLDIGDVSARTNLKTLMALLGNPDAANKSIYNNLGDFVGQTNLQSILAALGIPDVAGKPLYTCLITDRLDSGTHGLSALKTLIDAIQTDLGDPSARTNLKTVIAMLGNPDAAGKTIYDVIGDFVARTNNKSLMAALGIPDVAGKDLYTCLITDRLDNVKFGQDALLDVVNAGKSIWYCDSSVVASGAGTAWSNAFKTIQEAVTASAAGDAIRIKGEYDTTALTTITLDKELALIGENTSSNQNNTLIYGTGAFPLITVKANQCKIWNIGFAQQAAQLTISLGDTAGQAWWKTHVKNCKFDGYGTSTIGIGNGDTSDAPDIHIEGCLFRSFAAGGISTNSTRARIDKNIFLVTGSTYGITHVPTAGDRPDTCIVDNIFIADDNTNGNGIVVTNTPTVGLLAISGNRFVNFASPAKMISKRLGYCTKNNLDPVMTEATFSYLDAGGTQDIVEVTNTSKVKVYGISIDCNTLTQNGTLGFMEKVGGSTYREVAKVAFTVASDDSVQLAINRVLNHDFKFTWLEGGDEGADRALPYSLSYEVLD